MAQLLIILELQLDPFLVREGDRKLNFIPLKHLFFTYDLHVSFDDIIMSVVSLLQHPIFGSAK